MSGSHSHQDWQASTRRTAGSAVWGRENREIRAVGRQVYVTNTFLVISMTAMTSYNIYVSPYYTEVVAMAVWA